MLELKVKGNSLLASPPSPAAARRPLPRRERRKARLQMVNETKADSVGRFKLKVSTPKAGGPYSVTISDGKSLTLDNVLIGEVWLCSGQSNMQMPMKGYNNQPVLGAIDAVLSHTNIEKT